MRKSFAFLLGVMLAMGGAALAQVTVSMLPPATLPLSGNELVAVVQSGASRKATTAAMATASPGYTATYLLQSPNVGVPNSRTLIGTANEIILADGGAQGNLTLSTPQPIAATSSPTFAALTLTAPLTTPNGGTGFASYAVGDMLYAGGTTVLSKLPDVATGNVIISGGVGVAPSYGKVTAAHFSGLLPVANGGTGVGTLTGLIIGNGTSPFSVYAGTVCTNQFIRSLNLSGVATCNTVQNTDLANSSITINGTSVALGGTRTLTLASADFVNQGTTTTVLHGNAAGNPSFGSVVSADLAAGVFANPTASVGLTAVNGAATTCMRSDAAPPLSQAITPTWTGTHFWQQTNTGSFTTIFQNQSTGVAASTRLDIKNSAEALILVNTSTAFSGAFMTGGTTGESANIETNAVIPINIGVGGAARMSMNNAAAGRQVDMVGTTATSAAVAYAGILDQAGVRYGYWGKSSSGSLVSYESDADVSLIGNNGTDTLNISTAHKLAFNGNDMTPSSTTATWSFQTATSNCSINGTDASVKLYKIGNVVTARLTSTGTCTTAASASQITTNAPVPAAFRPANLAYTACITGNGSLLGLCGVNTSGQFITTLGTGTSVTWTLGSGTTFTYTLD